MARKVEIVVGADVRNAEKGFKSLSHSAGVSVGSLAKLAVGLASVSAAAVGIRKVVGAASDLNEEVNKAAVVFGGSSDAVLAWSKTTAGSLGIARSAALEAAGGFGAMLETAGLTEGVAAKFSQRLVTLAADMASFNNIDPSEALEKLKSGLAGEAEPLRTVGVLLSETRVKLEAYRSGIAKQGSVLTGAQKVQARYNLILQDTARQQGDFSRTSTGLANSTRIIKAEFQDAAAAIGSKVLPVVARAATGLAGFVKELSNAKGVGAKFDVAVDGIKGLGQRVLFELRAELQKIDVGQVVGELQTRLVSALNQIGAFLNRVDYRAIGQAIGDGLVRGAQGAAQFLQSVDWSIVGSAIVNGIRNFLSGVNWKAVAVTTVKLMVAAFRANVQLLKGIGGALGQALIDGLQAIGDKLTQLAARLALKIVEPFTHLPGALGRPFRKIKEELQRNLDAMEKAAKETGKVVEGAFTGNTSEVRPSADSTATTSGAATTTRSPAAAAAKPAASAAKSVETASDKAKKAFDRLLSSLQLGAEKASLTKSLADDIAANTRIIAALRQRAAVAKNDLDVQHQIVAALGQQKSLLEQQAQIAKDARQARQFRALGLSADGGEVTPGVANLRKQLSSLTDRIGGSGVNLSSKLKAQLAGVRKVLSGEFGKATVETRQQIQQLFETIRGELGKGSSSVGRAKFHKANISSLLSASGLDPDQVRRVRQQLSQVSAGGFVPNAQPAFAGAGGRSQPMVVEANLYVDGRKMEAVVKKHARKAATRRSTPRRGPYAGRD